MFRSIYISKKNLLTHKMVFFDIFMSWVVLIEFEKEIYLLLLKNMSNNNKNLI